MEHPYEEFDNESAAAKMITDSLKTPSVSNRFFLDGFSNASIPIIS